ncbi:MAG: tetratricopeptide repeat protein [Chthoniobacterales bacterium]|nr:tetratricopeptide repeat protein [Chthoniobacterales bacterium]
MKFLTVLQIALLTSISGLLTVPTTVEAARKSSIAGDPGGHTNRGVKYAKKKEYEKAIEEFTKAIELQPQDPKNYRNRALTYRLMGQPAKAKEDDAAANKLSPESVKTHNARARGLIRDKNYDAALEELDEAIDAEPRNGPALRLRAYVYLQQSKWAKAIADYTVAINSIREVDIEGRTRRGFAYRNLKKYDLALEDFSKVIEARPKDAEAYRRRIYLYRQMNENEKAIADLKKLLELKPNDADAKAQLKFLEKQSATTKPATAKANN